MFMGEKERPPTLLLDDLAPTVNIKIYLNTSTKCMNIFFKTVLKSN
jgi:hypothetical protein